MRGKQKTIFYLEKKEKNRFGTQFSNAF